MARAHARVTGDASLALRVYHDILDRGPGVPWSRIELAALHGVVDLGPAARTPAPLLRACRDRDERITGNGGGGRSIALDDEVRELAGAVLTALPPG
ncbi:hypothetical protein ACWGB8_18815 [Kitasatospora sp. NPDC054939]